MIRRRFLALAFAAIVSMHVRPFGLFDGEAEQPAELIELYESFLHDMLVGIAAGLTIPEELIVHGERFRRRGLALEDTERLSLMSDVGIRMLMYGDAYDLVGGVRGIGAP